MHPHCINTLEAPLQTHPTVSSQPYHHLAATTDPPRSLDFSIKLWKSLENKTHSSCCHVPSRAMLMSRCPSCSCTGLCVANTCRAHTGAHTSHTTQDRWETDGWAGTALPRITGGVHSELPAAKAQDGTATILSTSAIQNGKKVCHQLWSVCYSGLSMPQEDLMNWNGDDP